MGTMLARPLLRHILENDALTRGLADPEARILVEWLVEHAERLADTVSCEGTAWGELHRLCRQARVIGRFVFLWCHQRSRGAASQLAASEHCFWPLPDSIGDPCDLMQDILDWVAEQPARRSAA
jgi:hypothetical protein